MTLRIAYRTQSSQISFAVTKLVKAIQKTGEDVILVDMNDQCLDIVIISDQVNLDKFKLTMDQSVLSEGFEFRRGVTEGKQTLFILTIDESGAMYGVLELAEQLSKLHELQYIPDCVKNAQLSFRAIKFNLPWSSYRMNSSFDLQHETIRDLDFWRKFLDMMALNRFNVLTLWNLHPFPYMIRPINFPLATPFTDDELIVWKHYWTSLFSMAKERGIEPYIVNWNVFVSEAFREHYDENAIDDMQFYFGEAYSTEQIKQYNRECITQVIDEYPDLAGLGTSLGERMENMTPETKQAWIEDVYYEGMKNANRPVKFIHRAPFSVDPELTRASIENKGFMTAPVWVEVKFNWSHSYSSPHLLLTHGGSKGMEGYWNPPPTHYKITWMIRNEDFFTLRWAQPEFIREHLAQNTHDYVGGYYIGSECFIPAVDYSHLEHSPQFTWSYAFEKHWLYYMLWGRLLYDPSTPDHVFTGAIGERYGEHAEAHLLDAYSSVCRMPMALGSFFAFTWDFTLYAEGFLATDRAEYNSGKAFISLIDLLDNQPFNTTYMSLRSYADFLINEKSTDGFITPLQLADRLQSDGEAGIAKLAAIPVTTPTLESELLDATAWAHLSLYFSAKLRAGVSYALYELTADELHRREALRWLQSPYAAKHWRDLVEVTQSRYKPQPLMHLGETLFSWALFLPEVEADIQFVRES